MKKLICKIFGHQPYTSGTIDVDFEITKKYVKRKIAGFTEEIYCKRCGEIKDL